MNAALPSAADRYTYADYAAWPDTVRGELIDGRFHDLGEASSVLHQWVVGGLGAQLHAQLAGKPCRPLISPLDVLLPRLGQSDEQIDRVVQPDVLIVCDAAKLLERYVRGAPDFVAEVLSPATSRKDQVEKLALYETCGVREYWLLHPVDRVLTIYTQLADGSGYGRPRVLAAEGSVTLAILPDVVVDCDALFADLP